MEIRLLKPGYKNDEQFYQDFLEDRLNEKEYFSEEVVFLENVPDFPIYMGKGDEEWKKEEFIKALRVIGKSYIHLDRELILDETFWHSMLCTVKREYVLEKYPRVRESFEDFKNIVIKKFDWENYIYKCVLGAQYVEDNCETEEEKEKFYHLIFENLDVYNYIIKYSIFRNDTFVINILRIIDELGVSDIMKAKIKGRTDLGKDERYGRRVIFEFNKSYPIVMSPMLDKEELKKYFIEYLGYYYEGLEERLGAGIYS